MRTNQSVARTKMLLATLVMSLLCVGTAQAQSPVYRGKFTLPYQVHWGTNVLQPGDYTITIQSSAMPIRASIRKADGNGWGILVLSGVFRSAEPTRVNALLVGDKDGEPTVHSLSLADMGIVLIYDHSLAQESVQEARVSRTVPVMWAKK
jgi:hypothetical protein